MSGHRETVEKMMITVIVMVIRIQSILFRSRVQPKMVTFRGILNHVRRHWRRHIVVEHQMKSKLYQLIYAVSALKIIQVWKKRCKFVEILNSFTVYRNISIGTNGSRDNCSSFGGES